jgi:NAD(P)H-quinone oxidoreductase subunit 5
MPPALSLGLMESLLAILVAGPPLALLAVAALPGSVANASPRAVGRVVVGLFSAALAAAVAAAGLLAFTGPVDRVFLAAAPPVPLNLGIYVDSLSATMVLLITTVGLVIARFSLRSLDGEPRQGRFFVWLAFTVGAVLWLVIARNLLLFTAAWMLTSLGLHMLLVHYPDRPWAVWAARKKFLISRLGDVFLLIALGLAFACYGTADYPELFARADALRASGDAGRAAGLIGLFLVLGAMTKSAQVPFHSWLPDTMEAPTPVSALMHAGIINAGGYLVIRLSPLIVVSPAALDILALVGGVTALLGGLVMLSQTSIKRALAFSTVAQMGFMMLQCGLGAFSAALLHIVAHSAYKAHAFLASGSVLDAAARVKTPSRPPVAGVVVSLAAVVAAGVAGGICLAAFAAAGIDAASKPGGVVLGVVLAIALTTLLWQAFLSGSAWLAGGGIVAAAGVAVAYVAAWGLTDRLLAGSTVAVARPATALAEASALELLVAVIVVLGFLAVFAIQAATPLLARLPAVRALHVHAANGFYLDIPARRLTARLWGLSDPVP